MSKMSASFNLDDYAPVADRVTLFYSRFPNGRILTELISHTDLEIVFKAIVYRSPDESGPAATGWAAERIGDGDINTVACLENTETSAIGRALANLGLTAARTRPSREEMVKAARQTVKVASGVEERDYARAPARVSEGAGRTQDALQYAADRVTDALHLLSQAERAGLSATRATQLRTKLHERELSPAHVERIERLLRRYLAAASDSQAFPGAPIPGLPAV